MSLSSEAGDTSSASPALSSQGVSQSIQQSSISPVLSKYKQYLQSCYNARVLAPADKYLPTLESPYINLAMIRRGCYNPEQRDEFTWRTLHGGVDQILENKTPINIEDLLTPEDSGRPVRFILVEGPPGIGKSTFAWEVCRRWDEIESLRDYHTVMLLKLREKWVLNATSLSDLFRYEYDPDMSKCISVELAKTQGSNLLFVLDGFDEVSHSFHEKSVIKSILCRQLLPECTIILTTRPVAKYTLRSICQPQLDKHVEIIGFTEKEKVRYITKVFSKEPELQVNFLKYMFLVPHIKSMMYIPLNCAIIAQVYYESQSSHHLAIPRTRTQLYKALIHSLLVRYMKMKESNYEYTSMLPEGLDKENMAKFKTIAKFAFDSYHALGDNEDEGVRKVTFFKEDIPVGLVHFGFMNESTEMYASKGVDHTFSFLHLSLQEYLAAWHLADSHSTAAQVAYHKVAFDAYTLFDYYGKNEEEMALLLSLEPLNLSLVEPAIFLAGITGWRCQSDDDRNHWEMYLSHDTASVEDPRLLLCSLYEAQNPNIIPHYFAGETKVRVRMRRTRSVSGSYADDDDESTIISASRKNITISSTTFQSPYDCYALSYCLGHSADSCSLSVAITKDVDISLIEPFVIGLNDNCKSKQQRVKQLTVRLLVQNSNELLCWLTKCKCWNQLEEIEIESKSSVITINGDLVHELLLPLVKLQSLKIKIASITSWKWLTAIKSLRELRLLYITNVGFMRHVSSLTNPNQTKAVIDIELPLATTKLHEEVDSVLRSVLTSKSLITKLVLSSVCRETMAGVHNILLHCTSLAILDLKRTRLGYDGILHICCALRNNKQLSHLVIHDDLQLPKRRKRLRNDIIAFLSSKITCTDFLLELNNILKDNTTLEEMKIQSGLFLPLSAGEDGEYCQWTGLGPLQQFNVGAVGSGMSPNLRRSFSLSDLTQPQTTLFWDKKFPCVYCSEHTEAVDFKKLFSKRKEKGKKLFSLPSFTAPDTEVLQSFSGLDPRLKKCLEISHLHQYVAKLRRTYYGMLQKLKGAIRS